MKQQQLNGVYLVIDPSMDQTVLLERVGQALKGGAGILQIWNHWPDGLSNYDKKQLISQINEMADRYDVPVLINDEWEMLKTIPLDGVHFDSVPKNYDQIKKEINRDFIAGITCSNDLEVVQWAEENDMNYISFCAMFPSPSVGSCEIVEPETVQRARDITDMPLFLSGGITPDKIAELDGLDFNGVAVISGIMKDEQPGQKTSQYKEALE